MSTEGFIPKHGGYRNLITYQKAEIIFDGSAYFTNRFFRKFDRTVDQMVQAARSGKQNIAEASMASATSKVWDKNHKLVNRFRELNNTPNATYQTYVKAIENPEPEICANAMICLIKIVSYLLARQVQSLEQAFLKEGGLRERMTKARIEKRNKK